MRPNDMMCFPTTYNWKDTKSIYYHSPKFLNWLESWTNSFWNSETHLGYSSKNINITLKKKRKKERKIVLWDFPGSPVVKTLPSNARGADLIPGWGAKIPHALWPKNQNIKHKQYCNKFNKDLKNGPHQDFPGGTVVKTLRSQCRGPRFDPWSGN